MTEFSVLNELVDEEVETLDRTQRPFRTNKEVYDAISHELKKLSEHVELIKRLMEYDIPKTLRKEEAINPTLIKVDFSAETVAQKAIQISALCMRAILMDENEDGERKPADY